MKIETIRVWSSDEVRDMCVRHSLYTRGDNKAYDNMLCRVDIVNPTPKWLYQIARDIVNHSDIEDRFGCDSKEAIAAVMGRLEKEAVTVCYVIE